MATAIEMEIQALKSIKSNLLISNPFETIAAFFFFLFVDIDIEMFEMDRNNRCPFFLILGYK